MIPSRIARHDLVALDRIAWRSGLHSRADPADLAILADWLAHDRPLVARRRQRDDPDGTVALGLPLPPAMGKRRLGFAIAADAVAAVTAPPELASLSRVPSPWRTTLDALVALGRPPNGGPRVFGSFCWQHLTGLDYLTPDSDLDLLWPVTADTPALLRALPRIEAMAPARLDGELTDASGRGANWRELARGGDVLVKTLDGIALVDAAAFLGACGTQSERCL